MNNTTYVYLAVTIATLIFCGVLLVLTADQGIHESALIMAGLAVGHWFGYSNQLVVPATAKPSSTNQTSGEQNAA